ncbi:pseudouridine synthase [Pseudobacteriovorax antillogorgiicola]|uniref:tRNA pseudouridine synthase C n=1 Tax=Pseudobacteriovorax antillogorgiicola TaxID=1513793 RepID=A0A1Y6BK50_9BACT|nr:pseudouridine synthase [Pseudobacteriovorax antillogorgiicola]TCS56329.1 tRNA pseudouridine synthase C [Pseudobacteriovorax antillogorgiicola]SMF06995.1 tRNA pseudouridine synthase C [Pseudobacteriovorax antillogorgiicola]
MIVPCSNEDIPILKETKDLIAIQKPSGYLVHRSPLDQEKERLILQLLRRKLGYHLYPVHRLDKPTSGVLVLAKSSEAASEMGELFRSHQVKKIYHALVRGWLAEPLLLDYPLKHPDTGAIQECQTRFETVAEYTLPFPIDRFPEARYSLLQIEPKHGRRHQIRRHLKHLGHPIIGDTKYGKGNHNRLFRDQLGWQRLLLHCSELSFPWQGQELTITSYDQKESWHRSLSQF